MEIKREGSLITYYVDIKDQVTIICPACQHKKSLDASKFKDATGAFKVRCQCGEEFRCLFEFRKYFRKEVKLPGDYVNLKTGARGKMTVDSISMEGLGMVLEENHDVEAGHMLAVTFVLDNKLQTEVKRSVKVTSVRGQSAGGMFVGMSRNKTVGFYLMP